jgi:uroporphyrinogen-III synthase
LIVIRPEPGAQATCLAAQALGLEAEAFPLFAVRPLGWDAPAREDIDALLLGSANALRHGGPEIERYRGLPAYAVGETTAEAARDAGLDVVLTGTGGLQGLLGRIDPAHRRLLRLAGRERVSLEIPAHFSVLTREVYASEALPMPATLAARLSAPCLVLLHSGEAARHFARLCDQSGIARAGIHLAALAPRIAEAAGNGWATLATAPTANDSALLALARELCQGFTPGS